MFVQANQISQGVVDSVTLSTEGGRTIKLARLLSGSQTWLCRNQVRLRLCERVPETTFERLCLLGDG